MQDEGEKVNIDQFFAAFADTSFDKQKLKKTLLIPPRPSKELDLRALRQTTWVSDREFNPDQPGQPESPSHPPSSSRAEPVASPWVTGEANLAPTANQAANQALDPDVAQALDPNLDGTLDDFDEDFEAAAPEAFVPAQPPSSPEPPRAHPTGKQPRPESTSSASPETAEFARHPASHYQGSPSRSRSPNHPSSRPPSRPLSRTSQQPSPPSVHPQKSRPLADQAPRILRAAAIFVGVVLFLELSDRYVKQCSAAGTCLQPGQAINSVQTQLSAVGEPIQNRLIPGRKAFKQGVEIATVAGQTAFSAKTPEEWRIVVVYWNRAIAALQLVPASSRYYAEAQEKIQTYQRSLAIAKAEIDPFREGINAASQAAELTQEAVTVQDWQQVGQLWLEAIFLMRLVSENSQHYAIAQQRLGEYAANFTYAQKQTIVPDEQDQTADAAQSQLSRPLPSSDLSDL